MKRIVVGTDGSTSGAAAVEWAAALCAAVDAELVVTTAWTPADDGDGLASEVARREHRKGLLDGEWSSAGRRAGVAMETVLLEGAIRDELPELARREDADLVVIGASEHRDHHRLGRDLVHHVHRPLAVVPPGTWSIVGRPVVVGVDGSLASDVALTWAVATARALGSSVVAVFTHDAMADSYPRSTDNWRYRGEPTVHAQVDRANGLDGPVTVTLEQYGGRPEGVLRQVGATHDAVAIVTGTKGRGGLHGLVAGRVPIRLVEDAPRPVIVIPH